MKRYLKTKILIVTGVLMMLFTSCASVEEVSYVRISKDKPFEIRDYAAYVVAETTVNGSLEDAGNTAFRPLFNYISGQNKGQKKIAMMPIHFTDQVLQLIKIRIS